MRWISLIGWMVLCFAVGGVAGAGTGGDVNGWYRTLARPSFAPPDWIFGPVWTLLYAMMAVAVWRVGLSAASPLRTWSITLFLAQLALNFAWPWIFFRFHALGAGLIEIVVLWLAIVATISVFGRISPLAAWLMAPYLAWVTFATALNAGFWKLN
jgi:tryptophan-rich sensory protein